MSVKENLAALCQLEAHIGALTAQRDDLRRQLLDHAMDVLESEGAAPTWRAPLGTVGLTIPKPRVEVFDENAFAESALNILGSGAIEVVTRVRPDYRDRLLASATTTETGAVVTPDGEPVDGVTAKARFAYLNVRLTKEAKAAAAVELGIEDEAVA